MRTLRRFAAWPLFLGAVTMACESTTPTTPEGQLNQAVPPPLLDMPASADGALQTAVLSGGCFWGVEAVFEHVKGVENVVSGYSGGPADKAFYAMVAIGNTGHAESVRVTYDPEQISYGQILRVFFSVAHDPTQINRQHPDNGPQYRSNIFYANDDQRAVALAYIAQLDAATIFSRSIATRVDPLEAFYPAEDEHQDYLVHHREEPYIVTYDLPKLDMLRRFFPDLYRTP